jgi:hypothetical protein
MDSFFHPRLSLHSFCLIALGLVSFTIPSLGFELLPDDYPGLRGPDGKLIPAVSDYLGKDLKSYDLPVDKDMILRHNNFGYTPEEIQKYFTVPLHLTLDETGMDKSFFKPVPKPGVHPRVIFNPEDVPLIKERLSTTQTGKAVYAAILAHIQDVITGPKAKFGKEYDALAAGDPKTIDTYTLGYNDLKKKYPNDTFPEPDPKTNPKGDLPLTLEPTIGFTTMYEAFRCLIDNDAVGGKKVAAVITSLSKISDVQLTAIYAKAKPEDKNDFRVTGLGPSYQGTMGLDYDFAYNFMTDDQRGTVRSFLAHCTNGITTQAAETLRTLHCGSSNWISWSCRFLFPICAIEGEPGYDPQAYKNASTAQLNYINAIFPSGEGFEGWGKSFMFLEHLTIMAKRGQNIIGSTKIRAAYNDYFPASLNPWGSGFTFCDSLAGSGGKIARNADVLMYHAFFPNDVAGDFIYRNQIDGNYNSDQLTNINTHHPFSVMDSLCCAIFATDFNSTASWDDEYAQFSKGRPLTYFGEDTGNLITRSAWSKDALYLNYLTRTIPGGHQYSDRSHFSLYGNGRFWSIYHFFRQVDVQYLPKNRSVLLADDAGPSVLEARCADLQDKPLATFTATDLKNTWDYQDAGIIKPPAGAQIVSNPFTYNDFRLNKSPEAWMDYPIAFLPQWYTSAKPDEKETKRFFKQYDVKKAFRTAGVVRGAHPYSIIVDDLQLDDQSHAYDWGMILADDVVMGSVTTTNKTEGQASADIVLNEQPKPDKTNPKPETDRHLLVRVLSANSLTEPAANAGFYNIANPPNKDWQINKLHITSNSVSPAYKLLLFSYKDGEALPTTTWSADHTTATVSWPDQTDQLTFTPGSDGRTRIKIVRNGTELMNQP